MSGGVSGAPARRRAAVLLAGLALAVVLGAGSALATLWLVLRVW